MTELKTLLKNAKIVFADGERDAHGDDDPVCRLCGEYVQSRSSCSNRYMQIQGDYVGKNPETFGGPREIDTVQICDECFESHDIDNRRSIEVLGSTFEIDSAYRMND